LRANHVGRQARCCAVVPTIIVARQPPLRRASRPYGPRVLHDTHVEFDAVIASP